MIQLKRVTPIKDLSINYAIKENHVHILNWYSLTNLIIITPKQSAVIKMDKLSAQEFLKVAFSLNTAMNLKASKGLEHLMAFHSQGLSAQEEHKK